MQPLVAVYAMILRANYPDDHVISAICRGDKRRAATAIAPAHTPTAGDGGWIGRSNAESREGGGAGSERDIRALVGTIRCRCLHDGAVGNIGDRYRFANTTEIVAINQIREEVLA